MKKLYLTIFGAMSLTGLLEAKNSLMFNNGTQNEIKIHVKAAHKNKSNETRHDEKTFNLNDNSSYVIFDYEGDLELIEVTDIKTEKVKTYNNYTQFANQSRAIAHCSPNTGYLQAQNNNGVPELRTMCKHDLQKA